MKYIILSTLAAVALVGGMLFFKGDSYTQEGNSSSEISSVINALETGAINEKYKFSVKIGEVGSEHTHASMLFFVDGEQIDFTKDEYMLRSQHMHFENRDGTTIHKHATGVNLPLFLATLDIRLNSDCFMLDIAKEYCSDEAKKLTFIVNGEKTEDIYRELRDGDKILVNYGDESDEELMEKFDAVPEPDTRG